MNVIRLAELRNEPLSVDEALRAVSHPEAGGVASVAEAGGRGRATGCALRACPDVGCDEVSRAKSFPMFRAASQPDKSNNPMPTLTVRLIRLIVIILSNTCR